MKQILMSKEEYDQLILDMDNLKKEKEQLSDKLRILTKENSTLKEITENVRYEGNFLNQITTLTANFNDKKVKDCIQERFDFFIEHRVCHNFHREIIFLKDNISYFIQETDFSCLNKCLDEFKEETEYAFCVSEQLLYGSLLQIKIEEISKLNSEVVQLKEEIYKLQAEIDKKDNECKYQVRRYEDLRKEYNLKCTNCKDLQRTTELRDSYAIKLDERIKENRQLNNDLRSLSLKLNYYQNSLCIKLPKWAMRILKHLKRDKKNE